MTSFIIRTESCLSYEEYKFDFNGFTAVAARHNYDSWTEFEVEAESIADLPDPESSFRTDEVGLKFSMHDIGDKADIHWDLLTIPEDQDLLEEIEEALEDDPSQEWELIEGSDYELISGYKIISADGSEVETTKEEETETSIDLIKQKKIKHLTYELLGGDFLSESDLKKFKNYCNSESSVSAVVMCFTRYVNVEGINPEEYIGLEFDATSKKINLKGSWESDLIDGFQQWMKTIKSKLHILEPSDDTNLEIFIPSEMEEPLFTEEPIFTGDIDPLTKSAGWMDVEEFCKALDDNSNNYALRFLDHAIKHNDYQIYLHLRLKSSAGIITGDMGCEFTEALEGSEFLMQCLPLDKELFLTLRQGYDGSSGEFDTGIFSNGYQDGAYTRILKSLEGTVFEGSL